MVKFWIIASCLLTLLSAICVSIFTLPLVPEEALIFGRRLDLQASMSGVDIYMLDIRTHREVLLVESALEEGFRGPDFLLSPDGSKIFFGAYAPRECGYCLFNIPSGRVTSTSSEIAIPMSTVWSHDSRYIVYSSLYVEPTGIYTWDSETRQSRLVMQVFRAYLAISPDGRYIAVDDDDDGTLKILNSFTGETLFQFSDPPFAVDENAWSPDGSQLVFAGIEVYSINFRLENLKLMTPMEQTSQVIKGDDVSYFSPAWSPDGTKIVYSGINYTTSTFSVFVSDVSTLEQLHLAAGRNAVWSQHGDRIAFECNVGTTSDICIIRPDGTDLQQLTHTDIAEVYPQWLP